MTPSPPDALAPISVHAVRLSCGCHVAGMTCRCGERTIRELGGELLQTYKVLCCNCGLVLITPIAVPAYPPIVTVLGGD